MSTDKRYRVIWRIATFATSPTEAAKLAWETMRRPESTANYFEVVDPDGDTFYVDLGAVE